nr:hypothetical protein [Tanacetum cinerariifolium]
ALTQKVFANMRRVRKGFSRVETPLFAGMLTAREIAEERIAEEQVQADDAIAAAVQETVVEDAEIYHLDLDHPSKVLSMQKDDSKVQEV